MSATPILDFDYDTDLPDNENIDTISDTSFANWVTLPGVVSLLDNQNLRNRAEVAISSSSSSSTSSSNEATFDSLLSNPAFLETLRRKLIENPMAAAAVGASSVVPISSNNTPAIISSPARLLGASDPPPASSLAALDHSVVITTVTTVSDHLSEMLNKRFTNPLRYLSNSTDRGSIAYNVKQCSSELQLNDHLLNRVIPSCLPDREEIKKRLAPEKALFEHALHNLLEKLLAEIGVSVTLNIGQLKTALENPSTLVEKLFEELIVAPPSVGTPRIPDNLSAEALLLIKNAVVTQVTHRFNAEKNTMARQQHPNLSGHKRSTVLSFYQSTKLTSLNSMQRKQPTQRTLSAETLTSIPPVAIPNLFNSISLSLNNNNAIFTNLSNITLTPGITNLLNLGLKFIFKPPEATDDLYLAAFTKLARNIRLKYQFIAKETFDSTEKQLRIPNPDYIPNAASTAIELYIDHLYKSLQTQLIQHPKQPPSRQYIRYSTYLQLQLSSIKQLNLVIKPADKNLGPVVLTTDVYVNFCMSVLSDTSTYLPLLLPPSLSHFEDALMLILNSHFMSQSTKLYKYLIQGFSPYNISKNITKTTAKFYILPKIHKVPIAPRPIVSNVNYATYFASKWLHIKLFNIMISLIPTYIKDSSDVILDLDILKVSQRCFLTSADVNNLYPSIPINLGLLALFETLNNLSYEDKLMHKLDDNNIRLITDLSSWVLKNMYISFNNSTFLQIKGTAMGTPFAVVYSCIYLHHHEQLVLANLSFKPIYFKRFIDDLFLITETDLQRTQFIKAYQSTEKNISLSYNTNATVDFLDITIFKGPKLANNLLDTKVFQKAQNRYMYIPPSSYHKPCVHINLYRSELSRYRLLCTQDIDFSVTRHLFIQRLIKRHHSLSFFLESTRDINLNRNDLIQALRNNRFNTHPTNNVQPFIYTIPHNPRIIRLTQINWNKFIPESTFTDPNSALVLDFKRPIIIATTNAPNLEQLLNKTNNF